MSIIVELLLFLKIPDLYEIKSKNHSCRSVYISCVVNIITDKYNILFIKLYYCITQINNNKK